MHRDTLTDYSAIGIPFALIFRISVRQNLVVNHDVTKLVTYSQIEEIVIFYSFAYYYEK